MREINEKLTALSESISEHILAVKGTLELVDASVEEDDLHGLILKAVDRMDTLQLLSKEMVSLVAKMIEKISETKKE
jgi:hypothetical protein